MSVLLFLFSVSVLWVPDAWCQDYSYYYSNINTNDDNATITELPTELTTLSTSNTSQSDNNQTTLAETTAASTLAGTSTFPTQSPDVVRWSSGFYFSNIML